MSGTRSFRGRLAVQIQPDAASPPNAIKKHVAISTSTVSYTLNPHWHPYATQLMSRLVVGGLEGLLAADTDQTNGAPTFFEDYLTATYEPQTDQTQAAFVYAQKDGITYPAKSLGFLYSDGYSTYNWELFFHVPFMIATHLSQNGSYADAQRWFHYIFDPTAAGDELEPGRYWKVQPFKIDVVEHAENFLLDLDGADPQLKQEALDAITIWRDHPFAPHAIARTRPTAYMYKVVMAYLDNLIAWGDSLFRQDDRESINEALSLYVLAANILGPRPEPLPVVGSSPSKSYSDLASKLDEFGDALEDIEADIPFDLVPDAGGSNGTQPTDSIDSVGSSLYFCIPKNDTLLGYWDIVGDRLYKIRNSLNFAGVFQQLPLFPPPLDPGVLAQAEAAGVDVGALVAGQDAPSSPVRFRALLSRAMELCQEVKNLGAQLLTVMEKQDAEALTLLRAQHETSLLTLGNTVTYAQWQEAIKAREATERSLARAWSRYAYYEQLLGREMTPTVTALDAWTSVDDAMLDDGAQSGNALQTQETVVPLRDVPVDIDPSLTEGGRKLSSAEVEELLKLNDAQTAQDVAAGMDTMGSVVALIPDAALKLLPFGLGADVRYGGTNIEAMFRALATAARGVGARHGFEASRASKMAGYARREEEWKMQSNIAAGDLSEGYKQLRAAELREHIAKREYENHGAQVLKAMEIEAFLTSGALRNTPGELYLWMKGEVKILYNQCFALAYDVAKKAERGFHFELADGGTSAFIQSNYLSGRNGFLAGDKLYLDLTRMQIAYTALNKREFELTKHVSLREWFPGALEELRSSKTCDFSLDEQLFDLDCPGHAFRRVKSVALSVPSVTGPYITTNYALILDGSRVRIGAGGYPAGKKDTANFMYFPVSEDEIVTSSASADAGLFEVNLQDDRYLPFEGAGAISDWTLSLLGTPAFDLSTISDVILTLRYTARNGGAPNLADAAAKDWQKGTFALGLSMRSDFSTEWAAFLASTAASPVLSFELTSDYYPFRARDLSAPPVRLTVVARGALTGSVTLSCGGQQIGSQQSGSKWTFGDVTKMRQFGQYTLQFDSPNAFEDLWLVFVWSTTNGA
jgi:hypothetical protein